MHRDVLMNEKWRYALLTLAAIPILIYIGKSITVTPFYLMAAICCVIVAVITFLNPEHGVMILIFSMLLSPELAVANVPGRAVTIRIDDLLIMVVFLAWFANISVDKDWKGFVKTPLDAPLILLTFLYIFSTTWGVIAGNVNPIKGIFYSLKYIEYFILYWLTVNVIKDKKLLTRYLIAGLITSIIVTLYVYSQFGSIERASAPFDKVGGEPASLGGYYIVVFEALFAFLLHAKSNAMRLAYAGLIIFTITPFVKTLSRASYLAFVALVIIMFVLTKRRKIVMGLSIISATILFPIVAPQLYYSMVDRVMVTFTGAHSASYTTYTVGGGKISDESALQRIESWKMVLNERFPKNLFTIFFGNGVTGIGFVEGQFFLVLGEIGFFGVITFYWVLIKIAYFSMVAYQNSSDELTMSLSITVVCALIALIFQSLTTNTFIIVRIMEPLWFLTGLVMLLPHLEQQEIADNAASNVPRVASV